MCALVTLARATQGAGRGQCCQVGTTEQGSSDGRGWKEECCRCYKLVKGVSSSPREWDGVKKVRYESLDRDVVGTHEKPLVEEEEKFLEGFKERPL